MAGSLRYSQIQCKSKIAKKAISQQMRISQSVGMEPITADWLRQRLGRDRGKKAMLAEALGLGSDKISKMLSGARKPQAEEIPKILAFFGESQAEVDPELLEAWQQLLPEERVFLLSVARAQIAERGTLHLQSDEES